MSALASSKTMNELVEELFHQVEREQGKAFISDGLIANDHRQLFAYVRGALHHNKRASQLIAGWLRKYDEL